LKSSNKEKSKLGRNAKIRRRILKKKITEVVVTKAVYTNETHL
jgi:hypothetical protein